MTDAIPLGARFTVKRWLSDRERECTDPAELGMMDDIVAVDLRGRDDDGPDLLAAAALDAEQQQAYDRLLAELRILESIPYEGD